MEHNEGIIVDADTVLRNPKSDVWRVFGFLQRHNGTIERGFAVCRLCHSFIKYCAGSNTSNFHSHIKKHQNVQHNLLEPFETLSQSNYIETEGAMKDIEQYTSDFVISNVHGNTSGGFKGEEEECEIIDDVNRLLQPVVDDGMPDSMIIYNNTPSINETPSTSMTMEHAKQDQVYPTKLSKVKQRPQVSPVHARNYANRSKNTSVVTPTQQFNINTNIAEFLISNLEPASVVDEPTFRAMIFKYSGADHKNDNDKVSSEYFRYVLLPRLYNEAKEQVIGILKESLGCSLSTDLWTSDINKHKYATVMCHMMNPSWTLETFPLTTFDITDRELFVSLEGIRGQFGTDFSFLTTDSDMFCSTTVGELTINNINCLGSAIDCALNKSIASPEIKELERRCHIFVQSVKTHDTSLSTVDSNPTTVSEMCKLAESRTPWTSVYDQLDLADRILSSFKVTEMSTPTKNTLVENQIDHDELRCLLKTLRQIRKAINILKEPTTLSMILPIIKKLTVSLVSAELKEAKNKIDHDVRHELLSQLSSIYNQPETLNPTLLASILDPRYKDLLFVEPEQRTKARELLAEEATQFYRASHKKSDLDNSGESKHDFKAEPSPAKKPKIDCNDDDDWLSDVLFVKEESVKECNELEEPVLAEIERYMTSEQTKTSPFLWWQNRQTVYPSLAGLAKKYLCIQATCQTFKDGLSTDSAYKAKLTKRRILPGSSVDMMVFLHGNYSRVTQNGLLKRLKEQIRPNNFSGT